MTACSSQLDNKPNYWLHSHHINVLTYIKDEWVNCDLTNVCGRVLPLISGKLEVTFPLKC